MGSFCLRVCGAACVLVVQASLGCEGVFGVNFNSVERLSQQSDRDANASSLDAGSRDDGAEAVERPHPKNPNPWPMAGGNAGQQQRSEFFGPTTATRKWRTRLDAGTLWDPVIDEAGRIYVFGARTSLMQLSPEGELEHSFLQKPWKIALGQNRTIYIAVQDGTAARNTMIALSLQTREEKWDFHADEVLSMLVASDDSVRVISNDAIYSVASDGHVEWKYPIPRQDFAIGPVAMGTNGTTYVSTSDKALVAIARDGRKAAQIAGDTCNQLMIAQDETVFAMFNAMTLQAFLPNLGPIDSFSPPAPPHSLAAVDSTNIFLTGLATEAVADATHLETTGEIQAIHAGDLKVAWRYAVPDSDNASFPNIVIDGRGNVFFATVTRVGGLTSAGHLMWMLEHHASKKPGHAPGLMIGKDNDLFVYGDEVERYAP